jgi:two-component system cell cycle sensor histidine kinase/response regulator CckA
MTTTTQVPPRILLIDDNRAIHEDFRKILGNRSSQDASFSKAKAALFDETPKASEAPTFEIDSAYQGREGLELVEKAVAERRPYAVAFVDVRMPPGWDGIETVSKIWQRYPDVQIVICTAYSDYGWEDIIRHLGQSDSLVILKKPFDNVEVLQLAHALSKKWRLTLEAKSHIENLDRLVMARTCDLRISEERFSKAFRSNPLPMAIQSLRSDQFIDVNDSFLQLGGWRSSEVIGRTAAELKLYPDEKMVVQLAGSVSARNPVWNLHAQFRTKASQVREVVLFAEPLDLDSEPHMLLLIEDVTEQLNLEQQLRQAQKMEAIGQLAAGVAHDFNNMLTVIQGQLSLLLLQREDDNTIKTPLTEALSASQRAGILTRQLLAFSRKQVMERKPVRFSKLFEQIGGLLERLIGEQIQMEFQCPESIPAVQADPCNLEQVIMNLAVNARDAMPQGGRLVLSVEAVTVSDSRAAMNSEASAGDFVCLTVRDTGCGMDEATRARVFEPFFTTKPVGKGTGMGLASVYGIVKQHKGWIELESELGRGTAFRVYLPVSVDLRDTTLIRNSELPADSCRGHETILVVEDEQFIRRFVQAVLQERGYDVLLAADAQEALEIWRRHSERISLLLTDMIMPGGVTGKELAEKLGADKPELKVIFSSGYSLDVLGDDFRLSSGYSLLQKPYQALVLAATVRQCLDGQPTPGGVINNRWATAANF